MAEATARQRASIAISFAVQAAMIAALLGVPALESTHHAQSVSAEPAPVPAGVAIPQGASRGPATRLTLTVWIDGVPNAVQVPTRGPGTLPIRVNYIPPGEAARVVVTFPSIRLGFAAMPVWFAVAPASAVDRQLPQLGASQGSTIPLQSQSLTTTLGMSSYQFSVPAADLRPGDFPIIVMSFQDEGQLVAYGIAQLHAP